MCFGEGEIVDGVQPAQGAGKSEGKVFAKKHWFFRGFGRRILPSISGVVIFVFCAGVDCQWSVVGGQLRRTMDL
jgi:hypothetical protein